MSFQPQPDILPIKEYNTINYTFVGHGRRRERYRMHGHRYCFGNPLSATMFSYLIKNGVNHTNASGTVVLFESKLYARKIQLNMWDKVKAKLKDKVIGKVTEKIPYWGYIEKGAAAIAAVGAYVDRERINNKHANPYDPDVTSQLTLTGTTSKAEQYADYAISYWAKYPREGPMFTLQRSRT